VTSKSDTEPLDGGAVRLPDHRPAFHWGPEHEEAKKKRREENQWTGNDDLAQELGWPTWQAMASDTTARYAQVKAGSHCKWPYCVSQNMSKVVGKCQCRCERCAAGGAAPAFQKE
jgi:hypothetical protein